MSECVLLSVNLPGPHLMGPPEQAVIVPPIRSPSTSAEPSFPQFSELPFEIRLQIWEFALGDSSSVLYKFYIDTPPRFRSRALWDGPPRPGDKPFFLPTKLGSLASTTKSSRMLASTCLESRRHVLALRPHSFPFCLERPKPGESEAGNFKPREFILRFNGYKDIILFKNAIQNIQSEVVRLIVEGIRFAPFQHIRNLALQSHVLRRPNSSLQYPKCDCHGPECQDLCQLNPLPGFLARFPWLQTLYFFSDASADESSVVCSCLSSWFPSHEWPLVRAMDGEDYDEYISHDERERCLGPLRTISSFRNETRNPGFPYLRCFDHLEMRMLRPFKPLHVKEKEDEEKKRKTGSLVVGFPNVSEAVDGTDFDEVQSEKMAKGSRLLVGRVKSIFRVFKK